MTEPLRDVTCLPEAREELACFILDLEELKNDVIAIRSSSPSGSPEKQEARYIGERIERALQDLRQIADFRPK